MEKKTQMMKTIKELKGELDHFEKVLAEPGGPIEPMKDQNFEKLLRTLKEDREKHVKK